MGIFSRKHSIGKTIAELRKQKGWTQIELAEKLQVSDKAVSKWEKDNGAPSIEFFPILAGLFGVSIDYLMTGKEPEKEVVTMSKIELCAKNDDAKLFHSLSDDIITSKDENGKSLLDYVLAYKSKEVITALFAKYPAKSIFTSVGSRNSLFRFWYPEQVTGLLIRYNRIKELEELGAFSISVDEYAIRYTRPLNIYTAQDRKIILTDSNVSDELKNKYFQGGTAQDIVDCLKDLLDLSDKKQIEVLWEFIKETNEKNIAAYEKKKKEIYSGSQIYARYTNIPGKTYAPIGTSCNYYFFVISIPLSLLEKLLEKGYVDIARQANTFNAKIGGQVLNEERFVYEEGKTSGRLNEKELTILKFTRNGIVNIDELLATNKPTIIKMVLSSCDIHPIEPLCRLFQSGEWRKLFEYAVDNGNRYLADAVIKSDIKQIEKWIVDIYVKTIGRSGFPYVNEKELKVRNSTPIKSAGMLLSHATKDLCVQSIVEYFAAYRQQILADLSYDEEKSKVMGELTREYFESELKKGNDELVIIKLCVRLEAVLRASYHYEGDFSEMLEKYCSTYGHEDDGWGYSQEAKFVKYLQKLRMCRNSIVHAEKKQDMLTQDEIRFCIDYICGLN